MRLSREERDRLVERYAAGPARLRAAIAEVPEAARKWRPAPGEWSVHEIVCHCADSETNAAARIRYVVAEKDPVVPGYDENAWAAGSIITAIPSMPPWPASKRSAPTPSL